jgi:hypothetical protein
VPALAEGVSIGGPLVRMTTSFVGFLFFFSAFILWVDSLVFLPMVLSVKVGVGGGVTREFAPTGCMVLLSIGRSRVLYY